MIPKIFVNAITFTRIILSTFLAYHVINIQSGILQNAIIIIMIYATDFIDGKIARKFSACSNIGAVFDVLADLLFLLASGIAFITIGTYPAWMLTVLIGKFLEFCCTSVYVKKSNSDQQNVFTFDKLGRKVVILIYALPCISIILQSLIPYVWILPVMNLLCIPITIGAMVSSIQRIKVCIRVKDTIYT